MPTDRTTRVAVDLLEAAAAEGRRESRSPRQQLDYWARLGRNVAAHQSVARRRIEAVVAGTGSWSDLSDPERLVANAEIDARIQGRVAAHSMANDLNAEGVTTVSLDAQGHLVLRRPDGTSRVLDGPEGIGPGDVG